MNETRFVEVPTAVEARFDEEGRLTPTSFTWKGQVHPVTDVGRRWVGERENSHLHHYLVMTSSQEMFELCFDPRALRWKVTRAWERKIAV